MMKMDYSKLKKGDKILLISEKKHGAVFDCSSELTEFLGKVVTFDGWQDNDIWFLIKEIKGNTGWNKKLIKSFVHFKLPDRLFKI